MLLILYPNKIPESKPLQLNNQNRINESLKWIIKSEMSFVKSVKCLKFFALVVFGQRYGISF